MRRIVLPTILFAALAVAAVAVLAWAAHRGVRQALEGEFVRRIENLAATTAAQLDAADLRDARLLGEEGTGYLALLVQLEGLCAAPATLSVSVLDSARAVVYDCRGASLEGAPSPLEAIAADAIGEALGGRAVVTPVIAREGRARRVAFAPVRGHGAPAVAGVLALEVEPTYLGQLDGLRRQLTVITLVIALALLVLAAAAAQRGLAAARLERRLTRSENLAAMGRLTATLAHEIKNPLAIIRGSAKRLGRLDPESQRMADSVVEEVDRLTATVTRYLQFARAEDAAGAGGEGGAGDARAALDATLALLEGECAARRVALVRAGAWPDAAPVRLDADALKQVALNLVLNAIEAMSEGGTLAVSLSEARGGFELAFEDSGPGIPADTLRRLGDPFVTTKAQGSGLGLFLTRRLAQSGGGTLAIESALGRGTTCRVWLPRRRG